MDVCLTSYKINAPLAQLISTGPIGIGLSVLLFGGVGKWGQLIFQVIVHAYGLCNLTPRNLLKELSQLHMPMVVLRILEVGEAVTKVFLWIEVVSVLVLCIVVEIINENTKAITFGCFFLLL